MLRLMTPPASSGSHEGEVTTCAFSPDHQFVLSGGWDGYLRLWDSQAGTQVSAAQVSSKPVTACAVSPDGKQWFCGTLDGMLARWEALTHQSVSVFLAHTRPISMIRFAPDGNTLATASWDRSLTLWDLAHEGKGRNLVGHEDIVAGCQFTSDGRLLLSWSHDGTLRLWDVAEARQVTTLSGHRDRVIAAAISPDNGWAASGSRDGVLKLWDLQKNAEAASRTLEEEIRGCFFLLDGASVASAEAGGQLRLFGLPGLEERAQLITHLAIQCGDLAPSGAQLALGCSDGRLAFLAVDGFDNAPLVVTATRTNRRTATPLQRLFRQSRQTQALACTCPACRQSFELSVNDPTSAALCPHCRRQLRVHQV